MSTPSWRRSEERVFDRMEAEAQPCSACGSEEVRAIGHLGRKLWYRCRRCGHTFDHKPDRMEAEAQPCSACGSEEVRAIGHRYLGRKLWYWYHCRRCGHTFDHKPDRRDS